MSQLRSEHHCCGLPGLLCRQDDVRLWYMIEHTLRVLQSVQFTCRVCAWISDNLNKRGSSNAWRYTYEYLYRAVYH